MGFKNNFFNEGFRGILFFACKFETENLYVSRLRKIFHHLFSGFTQVSLIVSRKLGTKLSKPCVGQCLFLKLWYNLSLNVSRKLGTKLPEQRLGWCFHFQFMIQSIVHCERTYN